MSSDPSQPPCSWGYPDDILETIIGPRGEPAVFWYSENTNRTWPAGRPVVEVHFVARRRQVIAVRDGVHLVSRVTGSPYVVCRRDFGSC